MKVISIVLNNCVNDSRVLRTSETLHRNGCDVDVFSLWSHGLKREECIGGVRLKRIRLWSRPLRKWKVFQVIKYIEFALRCLSRSAGVDAVHCNDLDALPVGCLIKALRGRRVKVVYDAHELQTERNGVKGFERTLNRICERMFIRFADKVVTVSDSIAEHYKHRYKIEKPAIVMNCPEYADVKRGDVFRDVFGIPADTKIFLYQGGIVEGRGVEMMLEAFESGKPAGAALVVMGYGSLVDDVKRAASNSNNIFYHESVEPCELLQYTASADYGLSLIENTCLSYEYCLPNKLFEYIQAGLPVVVSNMVEMMKVVETCGIGEVAQEMDGGGLVRAIERLMVRDNVEMKRALGKASKVYCWKEQEASLLELYERV